MRASLLARAQVAFHLLVADGVWQQTPTGPAFRRVPPPTRARLDRLLVTLTKRIARHLVRRGWLHEDAVGARDSAKRERLCR